MERPTTGQEYYFEQLTGDALFCLYREDRFFPYGRRGQNQHGVDLLSSDRTIGVQCKLRDNADPKKYEKLIQDIEKDYAEACKYFPDVERFIVATTLAPDTHTQDALAKLSGKLSLNVPIEVLFWDSIERAIENAETHTANQEYAKDFERPLFLHKGRTEVCLKNLFVPQKYNRDRDDLMDQIATFTEKDRDTLFLLVEGDAGCGKTSLTQKLCWVDIHDPTEAERLFHDRPLVTIRLRDLETERISRKKGLLPALLSYLRLDSKEDFLRRFPRALVVLDGFDELCLIEGLQRQEYENLLYELSRDRLEDVRFLVTSRPNYIRGNIDVSHRTLALSHFDREKREAWVDQFEKAAGSLEAGQRTYLVEKTEDGVSDTPLTLYLLASQNLSEEVQENHWALYHHIFRHEIAERRYDTGDHPGRDDRETVYRINEEIAWEMYRTGSESLCLDDRKIDEIVMRLGEGENLPELTRHSTALCSFWKHTVNRGMVEFYHNNIRDFFLCEKVYRGLNCIYQGEGTPEEKAALICAFFVKWFQYGALEPRVAEFLYHRSQWEKFYPQGDFIRAEREGPLLPLFFERYFTVGTILATIQKEHFFPAVESVLRCAALTYRYSLEPWLNAEDKIVWWNDVNAVNESGALPHLSHAFLGWKAKNYSLETGERGIFRGAKFLDVSLFHAVKLVEADLEETNLQGADLQRADLRGADLQGANLHGASLQGANLQEADLRGADLRGADLRYVNLREADLHGTSLQGANLQGANLQIADLRGANLRGADLQGAILRKAILPDGFQFFDQVEQLAHLRFLNIPFLRL